MAVETLSKSSSLQYENSIPYKSSCLNRTINKRSFAYTVKKTAIVTGIALGATALTAGVTLAAIASAGVAILPLGAATVVSSSLLIAGGTGGAVSGIYELRFIKVNRVARTVLKAANLIEEEAGNLQRVYTEQGSISVDLVKKLQALKNATSQLGKKLNEGDKKLQETAKETKQTKKEQEKFEKSIQRIEILTVSLGSVLERLNNTTVPTREIQKLIKMIEKLHKQLDAKFPRIEQSLKEHNQALQELKEGLSFLQRANQSLIDSGPSVGLENAMKSIQLRTNKIRHKESYL